VGEETPSPSFVAFGRLIEARPKLPADEGGSRVEGRNKAGRISEYPTTRGFIDHPVGICLPRDNTSFQN